MRQAGRMLAVVAMACLTLVGWQMWLSGQQPAAKPADSRGANRLEFEVVESYDAKYLGDTPGHMGRAGGLERSHLQVALADPIYRGDEEVGRVTGLHWNRTNGSLDIEFDPVDHARVCVGDKVWMALDGTAAASKAEPVRVK